MRRSLLFLAAAALVAVLSAFGVRAIDSAGYRSGETVGTEVFLKGIGANVVHVNGTSHTATLADDFIHVDNSAAVTVTLPAAASVTGKIYMIGKGTEVGTNAVTIDPNGSELIDGSATHTAIDATGDAVTIMSTGTEWVIVGKQID